MYNYKRLLPPTYQIDNTTAYKRRLLEKGPCRQLWRWRAKRCQTFLSFKFIKRGTFSNEKILQFFDAFVYPKNRLRIFWKTYGVSDIYLLIYIYIYLNDFFFVGLSPAKNYIFTSSAIKIVTIRFLPLGSNFSYSKALCIC